MSGTEAGNANPPVNKTCVNCLPFTGDCGAAVALYKTVLGAKEVMLIKSKDERFIIYGSIILHDVQYMVYDDPDAIKAGNKKNPVVTYLCVEDVAAMRAKAIENGFNPTTSFFNRSLEIEDQFWGDSCASVEDPYGHVWTFAKQHGKDSKSEEMVACRTQWYGKYDLL